MEKQEKTVLFYLKIKKHLEERVNFFCELYSMKKDLENIYENIIDNELKDDLKNKYVDYVLLNNEANIKNEINKTKALIHDINNELYNTCNHIFIDDVVDTNFGDSIKIKYCNNCFLDYSSEFQT